MEEEVFRSFLHVTGNAVAVYRHITHIIKTRTVIVTFTVWRFRYIFFSFHKMTCWWGVVHVGEEVKLFLVFPTHSFFILSFCLTNDVDFLQFQCL